MEPRVILTEEELTKTLRRLAHEIVERNTDLNPVVLMGIRTGGAHLAKRMQKEIEHISGRALPLGILDITLYRDDLTEIGAQPEVHGTEFDFDIQDRVVVLLDDVLFTGRTIRSAIDEVIDFGRPRSIQLAVLIDRGHRELPIRADFVGKNIPTALHEKVDVELSEKGLKDQVVIRARKTP